MNSGIPGRNDEITFTICFVDSLLLTIIYRKTRFVIRNQKYFTSTTELNTDWIITNLRQENFKIIGTK